MDLGSHGPYLYDELDYWSIREIARGESACSFHSSQVRIPEERGLNEAPSELNHR